MASDKVPFVDLKAQYKTVKEAVEGAIADVFTAGTFIHGKFAERFATDFLAVHGGHFGVGCSNGTSAITLALRALGVGPGDEVLIPDHTFFGTAEPVVEVGARPILVDVEPGTFRMDLGDLESKITARTKVILPVHLYGNIEPMDRIMAIAGNHKLRVIEDCAQAHMGKWQGKPVGTFSEFGTFSFYPGKNLGAYGDAGFVIASKEEGFQFVKNWLDHGRREKYLHEFFGGNQRMDALQAAFLSAKVKHLSGWTELRRQRAADYDHALKPKGFTVITPLPEAYSVYHLYVVEVSNRTEVQRQLKEAGIETGVHYPVPLHKQPAFQKSEFAQKPCPQAAALSERILSLPLFPEMTQDQQHRVIEQFLAVACP